MLENCVSYSLVSVFRDIARGVGGGGVGDRAHTPLRMSVVQWWMKIGKGQVSLSALAFSSTKTYL